MFNNSKVGFLFVLVAVFAGLTFGWVSAAHAADVVFTPEQVEPVRAFAPSGPKVRASERRALKAHIAAPVKPYCYRVAVGLLICEKAGR